MLSQLLPTAEFSELARKGTLTVYYPPCGLTQRTREQSKLDEPVMAKTCKNAKIWPPYPSSLCSKTEATIHVFCINCDARNALTKRLWQGKILGKGLHGSLNALCTRVKYKYRSHAPLIKLLTVCIDCCAELDLYSESDQMDRIFSFKDSNETFRDMVLRIPYKSVEEIISSKVIMMEGVLLNTNTIKTVGVDDKWRKWYLWNQPRQTIDYTLF